MKAIVTVLGKDKVGIIADVAIIMKEYGVNICDISQTLMQEYFTMIMLVDLERSTVDFATLQKELVAAGMEKSVEIRVPLWDFFLAMNQF